MQNFDPQKLMDAFNKVEAHIASIAAIATVFAPFLPAGIGTATQDITELQAEVFKLKMFLTTTLPQVDALLGAAGVGAAAKTGATLDPAELKPEVVTAAAVAPPMPQNAPPGTRYVMLNGNWVLEAAPL